MIVTMMVTLALGADPSATTPPPSPEKSPLQIAQDNLEQAQQIYTQSCGDRAYGAYDDLCDQLIVQLRQYRSDVDKLERTGENTKVAARPKS